MYRCHSARSAASIHRLLIWIISLLGLADPGVSAERGLSHYLPGYYGDFAVAVAPRPGHYVYTTLYHYDARSKGPSLGAGARLEATASINGFLYATDFKILGAQYAFGGYTAYVGAQLDLDVPTPLGSVHLSDDTGGLSDTSISPIALYWANGNWHVNYYTAVFLPTGNFNKARLLNPGRNYYSLDNVVALSWLDPSLGTELSVVPGLMLNTQNEDTSYRTGAEFHLDFMINQFLSRSFAVGLHGYVYDQITLDRGAGAYRNDSFSVGVGPAMFWVPDGLSGKIVAKWLHEFAAENRFEGDIISITGMISF
jgi:hypothetical protein